MQVLAKSIIARFVTLMLVLALAVSHGGVLAQGRPAFSQQELDQMLAPVALYPDALLSQILMASTYPLEVVEAARWSRSHPNLAGDDAVRAAQNENWDPSVKSLLAFPQVLARMDENLQWMQSLGDAFLGQEPVVMDTVQNLRRKAQAVGDLRTDERMRVVDDGQSVLVQQADPQVVYVPYYDPMVVYGPWWWPAYPPVYWQPWPGYYARRGFTTNFYWGAPIGISAGFFFGAFDWPGRHVNVVRINNYYYNNVTVNRQVSVINRAPGVWQHDPGHRRNVAYRSPVVQERYASARPGAPRREPAWAGPGAPPDAHRYQAQPGTQPRANTDARAAHREPVESAEHRSQTRDMGTVPDMRYGRGSGTEMRREPAARIERPQAGELRSELRAGRPLARGQSQARQPPLARYETPRLAAQQARTFHAQPETRHRTAARPSARA